MVLENNVFVERVLPGSVLRKLGDAEMAVYRRPFARAGREIAAPTLTWPREIPIEGEPEDVVGDRSRDLRRLAQASSDLPKLFINAEPGAILIGAQREFCRSWKNQTGSYGVRQSTSSRRTPPTRSGRPSASWYRKL